MPSEKILLTNNMGKDIAYEGVENIVVRTTEDGVTQSGQQNFARGEAIEYNPNKQDQPSGVEINLAFTDNDQIVNAPEGKLIKSAIIKKPGTLVPENIAKGVEIAGVMGTMTGGGVVTATDIFPLQKVDGFTEDLELFLNCGVAQLSPEGFEIKQGVAYQVEWDGNTYTCAGIPVTNNNLHYVFIGNGSMLGFAGNGEPFAIIYIVEHGVMQIVAFNDLTPSHEIRVYQKIGTMQYTFNEFDHVVTAKGTGLTKVPAYSFYTDPTISTLDLGECPNLTTIELNVCYGSTIKELILPASLTRIDSGAFSKVSRLESVRFLGTLSKWLSIDRPQGSIFSSTSRPALYIDDVAVNWGAFQIPSGVSKVGSNALSYTPITSIEIPNSVTNIGSSAFNGCTGLTGVYITDISSWCNIQFTDYFANPLYYAKNLYLNGELVTNAVIPTDVTSINNYAFSGCRSLTSIDIPDSVTSIGSSAFEGCTNLTRINYNATVAQWQAIEKGSNWVYQTGDYTVYCTNGKIAKDGTVTRRDSSGLEYTLNSDGKSYSVVGIGTNTDKDVTIPEKFDELPVTSVGNNAFANCTSIIGMNIPDSVTSIGTDVFSGCSSLTNITLPFVGDRIKTSSDSYLYPLGYIFGTSSYTGGVATLQRHKGANNTYVDITYYIPSSLKFVTITGGELFAGAFYGCARLTNITLGDSVTNIDGSTVFFRCNSLTGITVGSNNLNYTSLDGILYNKNKTTLVTYPSAKPGSSFYIPSTVKSIGSSAFNGCTGLTSVTIGNGVTNIGSSAFERCTSLKNIDIPDSVTSIASNMFAWCTSLTSITIPNGVTSIGSYVFYHCGDLTRINYNGTVTQWGAITKGTDWNNYTGDYTVYCTGGTVTK